MKEFLTQEEIFSYKLLHKNFRNDQRKSDWIKAILMLNDGYNYEEISKVLLIDDSTIRRWYDIFIKRRQRININGHMISKHINVVIREDEKINA